MADNKMLPVLSGEKPREPIQRYRVTFEDGLMWIVRDLKSTRNLAIFNKACPDAEKMARSLCDWLNSGPDAKI